MKIYLVTFMTLWVLQNFVCTPYVAKNHENNSFGESDVINSAEQFVILNGYTDITPDDSSKITYEILEQTSNFDELLKSRHNTLERKAFGVCKSQEGWIVVFRYKDNSGPAGRAVTMNTNGKNIQIQHQDYYLDKVDRKLR